MSDKVVLDYRQHAGNVLGGNQNRLAGLTRAAMVLGPTFGRWMAANRAALQDAAPLLGAQARGTLAALESAPRAGPRRVRVQAALGLVRDKASATALLRLAALFGRI